MCHYLRDITLSSNGPFLQAEATTQCQTARQRTTQFVRDVNRIGSGVRTWLGVCDVDPAAPTVHWTVDVLETLQRGASTILDVPKVMKARSQLHQCSQVSVVLISQEITKFYSLIISCQINSWLLTQKCLYLHKHPLKSDL